MTDYSEHGALPVEDAASDDPPTVDEVLARQREEAPDQAATSTMQPDAEPEGVEDADADEAMERADVANGEGDVDDAPANDTEARYGDDESPA